MIESIDLNVLRKFTETDEVMLTYFLESLFSKLQLDIEKLATELVFNGGVDVTMLAHGIRSSALTMGAKQLAAISAEMENASAHQLPVNNALLLSQMENCMVQIEKDVASQSFAYRPQGF